MVHNVLEIVHNAPTQRNSNLEKVDTSRVRSRSLKLTETREHIRCFTVFKLYDWGYLLATRDCF